MKIAITGASGFIGRALIKSLYNQDNKIIALSRSKPVDLPYNAEWRYCDLFSAQSTADALTDVDIIFYLVHSMLPSSRLFQGEFRNADLLIADNISKACHKLRVKQIVYLGGIIPDGHISEHLESRREVEGVLQSTGIPVTVFRSGMVVGIGGSSFEILRNIVLRLPIMILPKWTQSKTQVIHIDDVVNIMKESINNKYYMNKTIDLVNGENLNYEDILRTTAIAMGKRRIFISIPIRSVGFSKMWVTIFGNSSYSLVSPLIDSLLCDLSQPQPSNLYSDILKYKSYFSMLNSFDSNDLIRIHNKKLGNTSKIKTVRSIQRLPSIPNTHSDWIRREYMKWLPNKFHSLIKVISDESSGLVEFRLAPISTPILVLQYIQGENEDDRQKFHIVGGLLTKTTNTGWLEFRQIQNKKYTLTAIHEFIPSLPWYIYVYTQAILHKIVMKSFGKHLERVLQQGKPNIY